MKPGPVLFVAYGSGHISKVAPVIRHLRARGVPCELLALTVGHGQAQRLGLAPLGYRDFLHLSNAAAALAWGSKLLQENQHPDVDEHESRCYLGVNYQEWVESYGEDGARARYHQGGRRAFFPVRFMGRILDHLVPSVVVSTASPRSEQAAIEAAAARGVPSLTMVDLFAMPNESFLRNKVFADRLTVLSPFVRSNLVAGGIPVARVAVTGCPAYESLFETTQREAGLAFRTLLGWQNFKVVLWAGNLEEDANASPRYAGTALALDVERRLRDWVASRSDVALIVRYHPAQYHLMPDLGPQSRVHRSVPTQDPLGTQLHASDIVVVQASTVGFEAALIGKRVLSLSYSPMVIQMAFDYGSMGLGESIQQPEDLLSIVESERPVAIDRSLFPPPGKASPRVGAEILALRDRV